MYMKKDKNSKEDLEKLNFEAKPEPWVEKLLRLANDLESCSNNCHCH